MRLFSTEAVSKYHPDKYADQISDAVLTACLAQDPRSRVACECLVKGQTIVLAGEITTKATVDFEAIARRVAAKLHYPVEKIVNLLSRQSPEIHAAVDKPHKGQAIAAGDQGMMVGFAIRDTRSMLPYGQDVACRIIKAIEEDVDANPYTLLKGDAKTQVTVDLDKGPTPDGIQTVIVSVCHRLQTASGPIAETVTPEYLEYYVSALLKAAGIQLGDETELIVNPGGLWTFGGPEADCGLTGRKIVCDQYGGYAPVGGGAFSGKDPSKVDRSGAYMARSLACAALVSHPDLKWCRIQIAYGIGMYQPVSVSVETDHPELNESILDGIQQQDLSPSAIIRRLGLLSIDYEKLAEGCHYYGHTW